MPTLRIRNASNTGWVDAAGGVSATRVRNASNTGWIDKTSLAGVSARNAGNTGWLTFSGGASYSVTPSASSVAEGGTVNFSISASGMGSGTLYWTNAGSTTGADFSDGQNSGSIAISSNAGSLSRTLVSDGLAEGSETIVIQLRTGSTAGPIVATASTVTVTETAVTQLTLAQNDLDFYYLPAKTSSVATAYNDLICTVDTSAFFSNGADHVAFAVDCQGVQGSNNPHCGPILRRGSNLWANARGFIVFGNGTVLAEQWNSTFSPGLSSPLPNSAGGTFNPATTPVFTVRIKGGYRAGIWANTMTIEIRQGTSLFGTLLFSASVPWGWDWTGSHLAAIAGIGGAVNGFVRPVDTGCVEQLLPRGAASAVMPFSGEDLRIF